MPCPNKLTAQGDAEMTSAGNISFAVIMEFIMKGNIYVYFDRLLPYYGKSINPTRKDEKTKSKHYEF